jgi:preprotein translocase subunit SecG
MTTADLIVWTIIIGFVVLVILIRRSSSSSLDKKIDDRDHKTVEEKGVENTRHLKRG